MPIVPIMPHMEFNGRNGFGIVGSRQGSMIGVPQRVAHGKVVG